MYYCVIVAVLTRFTGPDAVAETGSPKPVVALVRPQPGSTGGRSGPRARGLARKPVIVLGGSASFSAERCEGNEGNW